MTTAPVLFSSNMNDNEIEDNKNQVLRNTNNENMNDIKLEVEDIKDGIIESNDHKENNETLVLCNTNIPACKEVTAVMEYRSKIMRRYKFIEAENQLKIKRIRNIIEREQQFAALKLKHEKVMAAMKEAHLKELNKLDLRTSKAKAELAERILQREKKLKKEN